MPGGSTGGGNGKRLKNFDSNMYIGYNYLCMTISWTRLLIGHTKEFLQAGGGRPAVVLLGSETTVQKGFRAGCISSRRAELYRFLA